MSGLAADVGSGGPGDTLSEEVGFGGTAAGFGPAAELPSPRFDMPSVPPKVYKTQRHPWTMTPDVDFIVDRREQLIVACGCSGHAFKFGPALGRMVADVVEGGAAPSLTRLDRPGLKQAAPSARAPITR